jgi:hypothetical protein
MICGDCFPICGNLRSIAGLGLMRELGHKTDDHWIAD